MCRVVLVGDQPLVDALDGATGDLATQQAAALTARQTSKQVTAALKAASRAQADAYSTLADHVSTLANGDAAFILSTGYGVRNPPSPSPALEPPAGRAHPDQWDARPHHDELEARPRRA